jgi:hypothetical protein
MDDHGHSVFALNRVLLGIVVAYQDVQEGFWFLLETVEEFGNNGGVRSRYRIECAAVDIHLLH